MPTEATIQYTRMGTTKNRFKFSEIDEDGVLLSVADAKIGDIYVKKTLFNGSDPQNITITVRTIGDMP